MCKIYVDTDSKHEECTPKEVFSYVACYLFSYLRACLEGQQAAFYEEQPKVHVQP